MCLAGLEEKNSGVVERKHEFFLSSSQSRIGLKLSTILSIDTCLSCLWLVHVLLISSHASCLRCFGRKRVDKCDTDSLCFLLAKQCYIAGLGLTKDVSRAIELWTDAAGLGLSEAHFHRLKII